MLQSFGYNVNKEGELKQVQGPCLVLLFQIRHRTRKLQNHRLDPNQFDPREFEKI
jgi:hypothetical protein